MPDAPVSFGFSLVRAGESAGSYQAVLNPVEKAPASDHHRRGGRAGKRS